MLGFGKIQSLSIIKPLFLFVTGIFPRRGTSRMAEQGNIILTQRASLNANSRLDPTTNLAKRESLRSRLTPRLDPTETKGTTGKI